MLSLLTGCISKIMQQERVGTDWVFSEPDYQMNGALKTIQAVEIHFIIAQCHCMSMSTHLNTIIRNESFRGLKYL